MIRKNENEYHEHEPHWMNICMRRYSFFCYFNGGNTQCPNIGFSVIFALNGFWTFPKTIKTNGIVPMGSRTVRVIQNVAFADVDR
jgi:hypothetical protein